MAKNKRENKKMNPILWFIFAIVLPLIIVSVIAIFVLSFAGFDVIDWAKKKGSTVPVVSHFIKTDEEKDLQYKLEQAEQKIEKLEDEIEQLNLEINSLEAIRDQQEQDIVKLENQIKADEDETDSAEVSGSANSVKQTAASFRKMDQKKAADILQNLERDAAIDILKQLSNDVRGKILEEMEPKRAAELTQRLMEG